MQRQQGRDCIRLRQAGATAEQRIELLLKEGYRQGALFIYAPNPEIIHCPGDPRIGLKSGAGYTYPSLSPIGTLNGETPVFYKVTQLRTPSDKFLWIEENDPRGDNLGSWIMTQAGTPATGFVGSTWIDSPAAFHGQNSNFTWADGHASAHKWVDGATIAYAKSMNPNKFSSPPSASAVSRTAPRLRQCSAISARFAGFFASIGHLNQHLEQRSRGNLSIKNRVEVLKRQGRWKPINS